MSHSANDEYIEVLVNWLDGMRDDLNDGQILEVERLISTGQLEDAYEALDILEALNGI